MARTQGGGQPLAQHAIGETAAAQHDVPMIGWCRVLRNPVGKTGDQRAVEQAGAILPGEPPAPAMPAANGLKSRMFARIS